MRKATPSRTAAYAAFVRAVLNDKAIVNDPYAGAMLGVPLRVAQRALRYAPVLTNTPFYAALATRSLFFDTRVSAAVADGMSQVVTVAAGYDGRAWRFRAPGVRFFEVDHPATQAAKKRRAPPGGPTYVAFEFPGDSLISALRREGFVLENPAVFVLEGVTMYLKTEDLRALLGHLAAEAATRSRLLINFSAPKRTGTTVDRSRQSLLAILGRLQGERFQSARNIQDPAEFVASTGWHVDEAASLFSLASSLLPATPLKASRINPGAFAITGSIF